MKSKKSREVSITQPLLQDLVDRHKADFARACQQAPCVDSTPSEQPDLYQDPGSGYNANFVFPQD